MKPLIYISAAALVCLSSLSSCSFVQRGMAVAYNDSLIKYNQTITANGKVWGDSFKQFKATGNFAGLKPMRENMEHQIDNYISKVQTMDAAGTGGDKFKNEELIFLRMERDILDKGFSPFETFTSQTTQEEMMAAYQNLMQQVSQEETVLKRLQMIQEQYAKDNHFELKEKQL